MVALRVCLSCVLLAAWTAGQIAHAAANPDDEDQVFYANVEAELASEVKVAKEVLVKQAKVVEEATKNYAAAKMKQNIFKALREAAEKELELQRVSMQERLRQPRQEDEEDATDDNEATTPRTVPLIPVVANVLKAVFGGNNQTGSGGVNLTYHLQSVSNLINTRISGLTNLFGGIGGRRTTQAPIRIIQVLPVPVSNSNGSLSVDPLLKLFRREKLSNDVLDRLDMPWVHYFEANSTVRPPRTTTVKAVPVPTNQTSEVPVTPAPGVIYIDALTKDVQQNLGELIKAMPDLFKGVRDALALVSAVREFLDD